MERSLMHLKEIEKKAEEILVAKNEILVLEKKKNSAREGLSALKNQKENHVWMEFGSTVTKLSKQEAEELLKKDRNSAEIEINKLRSAMKDMVNELRILEYEPELNKFSLEPLSNKELNAIKQLWGDRV